MFKNIKKTQRGFTLFEMMIVLGIVGILSKIAYANYLSNIQYSRQKEAEAALVSFANAMEMWRMQNNNSYLGAGAGGDTGAPKATVFSQVVPINIPSTDPSITYYLTIAASPAPTATTYMLFATPVDSSDPCGVLKLDSTGLKSNSTSVANCW